MSEAEKLKKRMSHIFQKKGGEGEYTKLFENISDYNKELLLNDISLRKTELPVIVGFEIPAEWLLLTTERVVWRYKGRIDFIDHTRIESVESYIELQKRAIFLKRPDEIEITTKSNEKILIHSEEGCAHYGIWNVLAFLAGKNRSAELDEKRANL